MSLKTRLKHSWDAFRTNRDPTSINERFMEESSYLRPDRIRLSRGTERTMITAVYNRIALDVATYTIEHVQLDENKQYLYTIDSDLNNCFSVSANLDQIPSAFIQDLVMSMFDEGCVAAVPVSTTTNPLISGSYDIDEIRVGKIVEWYPTRIKMMVYNQKTGKKQELIMPKDVVAIIENPFFAVMNEPNSTVKRLNRKLSLMDYIDEQTGSGKLDLLIKLPYSTRNELRKKQAEERRKTIESQLSDKNKYGIAYIDSSESVTQLNRSLDNNLLDQIKQLMDLFFSQLGITPEIMNGTADEKVMKNYYTRTVEVILNAICSEMKRKFLTKTARTQNKTIKYYKEPFKLVSSNDVAELGDKLTRNEIVSSNEMRQFIGLKPVMDSKADELRNKNLNAADGQKFASTKENPEQSNTNDVTNIDKYINNLSKQGGTK